MSWNCWWSHVSWSDDRNSASFSRHESAGLRWCHLLWLPLILNSTSVRDWRMFIREEGSSDSLTSFVTCWEKLPLKADGSESHQDSIAHKRCWHTHASGVPVCFITDHLLSNWEPTEHNEQWKIYEETMRAALHFFEERERWQTFSCGSLWCFQVDKCDVLLHFQWIIWKKWI